MVVVVEWLISFVVTLGVLYLAYRCVKGQWLNSTPRKAGVFAALWIFGWLIYVCVPVADSASNCTCGCLAKAASNAETNSSVISSQSEGRHNATRPLSAANRVTAAFFPSRGGYETVASDNMRFAWPWLLSDFVYYLFHFAVVLYFGLLMLSIFGRHLIDKVRRDVMLGKLWTKMLKWLLRERGDWEKDPSKLREEMCVFWGDPEPARLLAENLRSTDGQKGLGFVPKILFLLSGWLKYEGSARAPILRLSDKGYTLDFVDGLPSDNDEYNVVGKEFELESEDVAGRRHFLLSENSAYNIGLAKAIIKKRSETNCAYAKEKLDLYIRVENSASSSVLKDWADAMMRSDKGKSSVDLDIHIFRETEIMAENFIERYPILKHRWEDGTETSGWLLAGVGDRGAVQSRNGVGRLGADGKMGLDVLIVGFGNRGQELLNKMIENSQFLDADGKVIPTRFAILDKCEIIGECCAVGKCSSREVKCPAYESYARRNPEIAHPPAASGYSIEFKKIAGDVSEDGFEHFGIKVAEYDRIVVCTGNDELNVQIGDIVRRDFIVQGVKLEPGRLFVQLQSNGVAERELDKYRPKRQDDDGSLWKMDKDSPIQYFGMWKDIFNYKGIVDEDKYYGAQLLNWRYNYSDSKHDELKPPTDTIYKKNEDGGYRLDNQGQRIVEYETVANKWRTASWFDKESSVASYRGMKNILALMGYGLAHSDSSKKDEKSAFREGAVDSKIVWGRLARVEHLRWMAFMRTHGVRSWDLINPSIDEIDRIGKIVDVEKKKVKANVRGLIGCHAALVDYDKLPDVNLQIAAHNDGAEHSRGDFIALCPEEQKVNKENLQWNDLSFVQWIPDLFERLWEPGQSNHWKIVKIGD